MNDMITEKQATYAHNLLTQWAKQFFGPSTDRWQASNELAAYADQSKAQDAAQHLDGLVGQWRRFVKTVPNTGNPADLQAAWPTFIAQMVADLSVTLNSLTKAEASALIDRIK